MSDLEKDNQLLHFIETKQEVYNKINDKDIYYVFTKSIRNSIVKTYTQLNHMEYSIYCSNIVFSIFWIVLSYTNNLKLTLFLCERSIILFIEYITLSNSMTNGDPINITDVKLFIYRKTIGPINIYKNTKKIYCKNIEKLSIITKELLVYIFTEYIHTQKLGSNVLEDICCLLCGTMYKLTVCKQLQFIQKHIYYLCGLMSSTIENSINITKIKLELYLYLLNNMTNANADKIYNNYTNIIDNIILPVKYQTQLFDNDIELIEHDFYSVAFCKSPSKNTL